MKATRSALLFLREADVSPGGLVLLAVVVGAVLPVTLAVDLIAALDRSARRRRVLAMGTTTCPAGHPVSLTGGWACVGCGFVFAGHAWDRCTQCGLRAAYIKCPCALSIANPLPLDEDAP